MNITVLAIICAMVAINAVFSAYEIALASVSIARLQVLVQQNRPGAKAALAMKRGMERSLAALQVGITLVGAIGAAAGGAGAEAELAPGLQARLHCSAAAAHVLAVVSVVIPLTVFTILFGELVPKIFAIRNKEAVCLWLSRWIRLFAQSVHPAVWCLEKTVLAILRVVERFGRPASTGERPEHATLQEIHAQAAYARAARLIGPRQEEIIVGVSRLSCRPVREIMLPAADIIMIDVHESLVNSLIAAHMDMHTRYPVTEKAGDPQQIVGYVNFKDIVALMRLSHGEKPELRSVVREMPSIGVETPIAAGMERMIHEHAHIAIVRDAAGLVVGMITLEDILEEFVGDIQDEYDRLPAHVVASGGAWIAGGGVSLAKLQDALGLALPPGAAGDGTRTLNGLVTAELGRAPRGGDLVEVGGVRVFVRKIRRQMVLEAQVSAAPPKPA